MKRPILLSFFLITLLFSCDENEITPPQSKGSLKLSSKEKIDLSGRVHTHSFPVTPEELYIARDHHLYAVDYITGSRYELLSFADEIATASTNGFIYAVGNQLTQNPTDPYLQKVNPNFRDSVTAGAPGATWPNTDAMTALGGYVYIVEGGTLYRVNETNGSVATFSDYPTGWAGTEAMAAINGKIYAVAQGGLWQVTISNGDVIPFSDYPDDWADIDAMAAGRTLSIDYLYAVQYGTLWRVNLSNGDVEPFSDYPNGWEDTRALTFKDGYLFGVQGDLLWKVNTSNGDVTQLGNDSWTSTTAMAARL